MLTKTRLPSLQTFWQVYRGSTPRLVFTESFSDSINAATLHWKPCIWGGLLCRNCCVLGHSDQNLKLQAPEPVQLLSFLILLFSVLDCVDVRCVQKTHSLKPAWCITQAVKVSLFCKPHSRFYWWHRHKAGVGGSVELGSCSGSSSDSIGVLKWST